MTKDNGFKKFVKSYWVPIIVGGVIIGYITLNALLRRAFMRGGLVGFHATIDWFDKTFEGLNLRALYETWALENPDKIVYYK